MFSHLGRKLVTASVRSSSFLLHGQKTALPAARRLVSTASVSNRVQLSRPLNHSVTMVKKVQSPQQQSSRTFFGFLTKKVEPENKVSYVEELKNEISITDEELPTLEEIENDPECREETFEVENFNFIMQALLEMGKYKLVQEAFISMILWDVHPNIPSWWILIESFKRAGAMNEFEEFASFIEPFYNAPSEVKPSLRAEYYREPTDEDRARFLQQWNAYLDYENQVFQPFSAPENSSRFDDSKPMLLELK